MDNQDKKEIDIQQTILKKDELYNCKRKVVNECQQGNESPSTSKSENLPSNSQSNQEKKPKKKKNHIKNS